MPNRRPILAVACLMPAISFTLTARAQVFVSPSKTTPSNTQPRFIDDLKTALPYIPWEGATHGPLIAIAPEKVHWNSYRPVRNDDAGTAEPEDEMATQPLYTPTDRYGLSADRVARHFSRKLIRLSTLAVFAPPKMYLLNTNLKPANPYLGADVSDKMRRLEATLTPAQWQLLGGPNGIGVGDLTKDQQDLFDAALPLTMTVRQGTVREFNSGIVGTTFDGTNPQTLTTEQRQGVRLRVERKANLSLLGQQSGYSYGFATAFSDPIGTKKLNLVSGGKNFWQESSVFGQEVRRTVPNRLKPSDLDLGQPNLHETYVALTGVQTVGDLLKAVRSATGLEVYADGRLGQLSAYISSDKQSVRAADLLEALCWSLTATYRKVGPAPEGDPKDFAYVLTYDRVGLATMHGLIYDWARQGGAALQAKNETLNGTIEKQKPLQYLKFADNDPMAPTPQSQQALRDFRVNQAETGTYNGQESVPIASLSPTQQRQVSDAVERTEKQRPNNPNQTAVRTDRVGLQEAVGLTYVIPGVGEVSDNSTWSDGSTGEDDSEKAAIEAAQKKRQVRQAQERENQIAAAARERIIVTRVVVNVAPSSAEEVRPLLDAAHGLRIDEVWVTTPNTAAGRALLAQCVAAGSAAGVKVGARVALIDAPADTSLTPGEVDRNLFGETGSAWRAHMKRVIGDIDTRYLYGSPIMDELHDTLAPESPMARGWLGDLFREIAEIPGLYSIALVNAASPGRDWSPTTTDYSSFSWAGGHFGYTVANRLAFLRQKGYDPIDLGNDSNFYYYGAQNLQYAIRVPRFDTDNDQIDAAYSQPPPDPENSAKAWQAYLAESECDMLRAVHADLLKNHPLPSVYLSSYVSRPNDWNSGSYARWRDGEVVPFSAKMKAANPVAAPLGQASAASGMATSEVLRSFPLGAAFAAAFAPDAVETAPNGSAVAGPSAAMDSAAYYIYLRLKPTPGRPAFAATPPGIVLDLVGLKPADALTLLKGTLGRLSLTVVRDAPKTP